MSKPVLPNQNDRYWGYNLNNYLLSLDKRVQTLETAEGDLGSIAIAMGPGFVSRSYKSSTGSYDISDKAAGFPSILISGDIYFGAISNGGMVRTKKTLTDYQLFKTIAFTTYNTTENKWSNPVETPDAKLYTNRFLNVYLMKTDSGDAVQTVIANDFIFREDMVLVGTLEKTSDTPTYTTFIPRTFDSSKTLYQTAQDSMSSYARLDQMTFGTTSSTTLPVSGTFYPDQEEGKAKVNFLFGTNGINPTVTPEPTSDKYEEEFDLLRKIVLKEDIIIWYESAVDGEMFTTTEPDLGTDQMISYYVAPSGNLYTQIVARPALLYDFNTEVIDNLRLKSELRCGSLVYLGSICKDEASYLWYGAKGNGISPTVVDIDNWNPYKVFLPHRQYYTGEKDIYYTIDLHNSTYNPRATTVHITKSSVTGFRPLELTTDLLMNDAILEVNSYGNPTIQLSCASTHYSDLPVPAPTAPAITLFDPADSDYRYDIRIEGPDADSALHIRRDADTDYSDWSFEQNGVFSTFLLQVRGNADVTGSLDVGANTDIVGSLDVQGVTNLSDTEIVGDLSVSAEANIVSAAVGTLTVSGKSKTSTLEVSSTATFKSGITVNGDISVSGATNYTSDIRLKTNIQPINQEQCYKAVQQLPVSTYTYTTTKQDSLGLIAQDIEKYLPEYAHILVHEDENGYKSVFEHKLLFILWEALKHEIIERKKLGGN